MAQHATDCSPEALFRMNQMELNAVQEGVLITDASGTILAMNDAVGAIFGFGRAELLGRTCRFFQGPATDPRVLDQMHLAKKSGTVFSGEVLNYRKDCSAVWNQLTISPWRNHRHEVTHFVGVIQEITQPELGRPSPEASTLPVH